MINTSLMLLVRSSVLGKVRPDQVIMNDATNAAVALEEWVSAPPASAAWDLREPGLYASPSPGPSLSEVRRVALLSQWWTGDLWWCAFVSPTFSSSSRSSPIIVHLKSLGSMPLKGVYRLRTVNSLLWSHCSPSVNVNNHAWTHMTRL